jgi:hypothetical protein
VGYAIAARAAPDVAGAERYLSDGWTPSSALFLLTAGSGSLAIVGALLWQRGTAPMPSAMRPLVLFGRASLSHYVLHIAVAYSALRVFYPDEDWPVLMGFLVMLAYLAVGVPLTLVWFRAHTHGPLETLWARTSRRPAPHSRTDGVRASAEVAVRRADGDAGLFARRSFAPGEIVLRLDGRIVARPTRHTIQLAPGEHLEPFSPTACPWVYLNHSCAPNVAVDVSHRVVIARHPIAAGDELRFDYDTTEWELAEPFVCRCGAPDCVGTVRGFRHLPADRQRALLAAAAPSALVHRGVSSSTGEPSAGTMTCAGSARSSRKPR